MISVLMIVSSLAVGAGSESGWPPLPAAVDVTAVRSLVVQSDGRWMPLDTVARDLVSTVTGSESPGGRDAVALLLAWTFDPQAWQQAPVVRISNAELRRELELPADQTTFSYARLTSHGRLLDLIDALEHVEEGRKLDPLEAKVSDISNTLSVLQAILRQSAVKLIPDPRDPAGAWRPIVVHNHADAHGEAPVEAAWAALGAAFRADDGPGFAAAGRNLAGALAGLPAAYRPPPGRIAMELTYNEVRPFRLAWIIMAAGAILSIAGLFARRTAVSVLSFVALLAGFAVLTWGLYLRWQIADRIPASNMFESLLFLSWGAGAFAILSILIFRDRMVPMTASVMGAASLMLADCLPMDHFVRPIAPVLLDTIWMSIHVPIIMVSYSVLALAVLIAHVQLFTLALAPQARRAADKIDSLHYWYVHVGSILLATGIFTGSMWAASSWGRYWGWDPKEVWSLVALLGYLAILHVRAEHAAIPRWGWIVGGILAALLLVAVVPKFDPLTAGKLAAFVAAVAACAYFVFARGYFATAVKSILAFWMIIMTYLGVNYVLGIGLHSYGFGTGAMARYMILVGSIDLLIVAALWVVGRVRGATGALASGALITSVA
ncbi:MAG: hypothetical protein C4547_12820 [Phycisphaerales bacterium]|nr:MAG: hypothetical protein C4547_12820 [Phycisphaerales bacterium]